MRISFTGTQNGMTQAQKDSFVDIMSRLEITSFIHGDCVVADEESSQILVSNDFIDPSNIEKYPSNIESKRAHTKEGKNMMLPMDPLLRNKLIVESGDVLIAVPKGFSELKRSGIWSTVRHARKMRKDVILIFPNGVFQRE